MSPRRRPLLTMAVGVLLVASPLYLFADSGTVTRTFEAKRVTPAEDLPLVDIACTFSFHRSCALDRLVLSNCGELRIPVDGARQVGGWETRHARHSSGLYRRTARLEGDSLVLELERVSPREVFAVEAVPASSLDPVVRRTVAEGTATTTRPVDERVLSVVVAYDGAYYTVHQTGGGPNGPSTWEQAVAVFGVPAGFWLLLYGREKQVRTRHGKVASDA